ncbi:MAG: radical SAM protein, partial [Acidobacteria bacterium]|nr:radical SAM protein [Acidobacteriota bacterium]
QLGGRIGPILDTIRWLHENGVWLEIVTLVIRGFNDSDDELRRLAEFLASVSPDIPWHVTAFHSDYKMAETEDTRPEDLVRAARIGKSAGLNFVYAGNLPGRVNDFEDTRCSRCRGTLVRRYGYFIEDYRITANGCCPDCGNTLAGRWADRFEGQIADRPFVPGFRSSLVTLS